MSRKGRQGVKTIPVLEDQLVGEKLMVFFSLSALHNWERPQDVSQLVPGQSEDIVPNQSIQLRPGLQSLLLIDDPWGATVRCVTRYPAKFGHGVPVRNHFRASTA